MDQFGDEIANTHSETYAVKITEALNTQENNLVHNLVQAPGSLSPKEAVHFIGEIRKKFKVKRV
jgi:hypothetical protein